MTTIGHCKTCKRHEYLNDTGDCEDCLQLAEARREGAREALKKMSEWALDCMEGEGPEAFEAYENCHVTAANLSKYYEEKTGEP